MAIPVYYNLKNLTARKFTTILTSIAVALVVFVFADVLMLAYGIKKTLVDTGSDENAIVIRRSSVSEVQSSISRDQAGIVEIQPEIAMDKNGKALVSKEVIVLISLIKKQTNSLSNVTVRGTFPVSVRMRPQIKIKAGRIWREGLQEIIVGSSIAKNFSEIGLGSTVRFALRDWRVVGIFDGGGSGFDSEVWADLNQVMASFRRPVYSSITVRLKDINNFEKIKTRLETDPRLTLEVKRERKYYAEQSEIMATFLKILGLSITIIFSLGSMISAMVTMYGSVANRVTEIGTLRVLGFRRTNILIAFLMESIFISAIGGIVGLVAASFMQFISISTMNWQTFSELSFSFTLTPTIAIESMVFAIVMGIIGGFLPAVRASRIDIISALRST